ncbi:MAG: amino acid ABC transporter permease [Thermoflexales bacterium]|nr:amino acid ABC transporter permease [Thermoflexales bacterium]
MAVSRALEPPKETMGPGEWMRKNLLSPWYNALLTVIGLWFLYEVGRGLAVWALTRARWEVVTDNLRLFLVGQFPPDQVWRIWLGLLIPSFLFGLSGGLWSGAMRQFAGALGTAFLLLAAMPASWSTRGWLLGNMAATVLGYGLGRWGYRRPWGNRLLQRIALSGWILSFPILILFLYGFQGNPSFPRVETSLWGGLLLTFLLSLVSIVLSFPLGVLLALGRRSGLPALRLFSILYIELIRGVPLVTVLFMADIMLPLFLPEGLRIDRVVRAMAGFTLFSAAYIAENVRGGLQAIPEGQIEAARALGLNGFQTTLLIVLPQALRMVIPANVGQFISLFKDTSLVAIMGLLELLGIGKAVLANPAYMGLQQEVYLFVALIYGVFSYAMSYASRRLEKTLGVGER